MKVQKYCKIFSWVEAQDSDFAQALEAMCLPGTLNVAKGQVGKTFLFPTSAERKGIIKGIYGPNPEEAIKKFNSYVIPDFFGTAKDFTDPTRSCGNILGVSFGKATEAGGVVSFSGFKIRKPEKKEAFDPLDNRKEALAVWIVESGEPPLEGGPYKAPFKQRKIKGGAEKTAVVIPRRASLAYKIACEAYVHGLTVTFLKYMVGFLNYLKATNQNSLLDSIKCILDYDPVVSFYLVFEPYKVLDSSMPSSSSSYIVSDDVLNSWNCAVVYRDAVSEYLGFFDRNNAVEIARIETERAALASNGQLTFYEMCKKLKECYDRSYGDQSAKKLWQDDFRGFLHAELNEHDCNFGEIVKKIQCLYPGNDYVKECQLKAPDNPAINAKLISRRILEFVWSSDFLYVPDMYDPSKDYMKITSSDDLFDRSTLSLIMLKALNLPQRTSEISDKAKVEAMVSATLFGTK